jgi:hypothetical protein
MATEVKYLKFSCFICLLQQELIFYCETDLNWDSKEYSFCLTRKERSGLACVETGIWKLRWMRKEYEEKVSFCAVPMKMLYVYY